MKKKLFSILALLCMAVTGAWAEDVTEVLTWDKLLESGKGSAYQNFSGKTITSDAVYAGSASTGADKYIQLRSSKPAGIVTTTSGGTVKSVTIEWNTATTVARTVSVYGKNSAYAESADLYDNNAGDLLGEISTGDENKTLTITGNYTYIGIRSKQSAQYINKITIVWEAPATSDEEFDLTVGTSECGEIIFTVNDEEVEKAKEGDVVTVTVVSDDEHVAAEVTGQWYAAIAASRVVSTGTSFDMLTDIEFTPVEGTYNQWTFTMQRANAEISASYWDITDLIELIRKEMNTAVVFLATYGNQLSEADVVPLVIASNDAYILLERHDRGEVIPLDEALEVYMKLKKLNGMDYGVTTRIENVNGNVNGNRYYDLNGRRVAQPTKGVYILNGHKVVIK